MENGLMIFGSILIFGGIPLIIAAAMGWQAGLGVLLGGLLLGYVLTR
jgi:hypothetical protein